MRKVLVDYIVRAVVLLDDDTDVNSILSETEVDIFIDPDKVTVEDYFIKNYFIIDSK